MSWHSKRHNIKHKKAATDAKKSKVFARIGKQIQIAAKNGPDPSMNPGLAVILEKAKAANLTREIIDRAIKKWSGQIAWEELEEVIYEWYGPAGVAMLVKCITSNKNRTSADIKSTLAKMWWNMWEPWSVSWQFENKWVIYITWKKKQEIKKGRNIEEIILLNEEEFEDDIMSMDIDDYDMMDGWARVVTSFEGLFKIKDILETKNYNIESAEIEYIPKNYIDLSPTDESKLETLIDFLEENEDIDSVFHNAN